MRKGSDPREYRFIQAGRVVQSGLLWVVPNYVRLEAGISVANSEQSKVN
jgi:hypothetical protein